MPSLVLDQVNDTHLPTISPISSLHDLQAWSPREADLYNVANVPLHVRPAHNPQPQLMLTHDMMGGYKEDNLIQGNSFEQIYSCQYWQYVDSFVYFSHHRVTIPPVQWINSCHRNGVKVLGTFIVEGADDGSAELEYFLYGQPKVENKHDNNHAVESPPNTTNIPPEWSPFFANKLVDISEYYGFDGWLINIESPFLLEGQTKADALTKLMNHLQAEMHKRVPGSMVIWYDSMITNGTIEYRNRLDEENKAFFNATDGIFINYWWNDTRATTSKDMVKRIGRSETELYFGTDVWGRGTYYGGNFNSHKAVTTATAVNASSALFGMAWTYEYFGKKDFDRMEKLFWLGGESSEYPKMSASSKKTAEQGFQKGIANVVPARQAGGLDWFASWFDRGYGKAFHFEGIKLLSQPWSHLSHQSVPPNILCSRSDYPTHFSENIPCKEAPQITWTMTDEDAYIGGTSMLLKLSQNNSNNNVIMDTNQPIREQVPLYSLNLDITNGGEIQFAYKPTMLPSQAKIAVYCNLLLSSTLTEASIANIDRWVSDIGAQECSAELAEVQLIISDGPKTKTLTKCLGFSYKMVYNETGWITGTVSLTPLPLPGDSIAVTELGIDVSLVDIKHIPSSEVISNVGYVSIHPLYDNFKFIPRSLFDQRPSTLATQIRISDMSWKDTNKKGVDQKNVTAEPAALDSEEFWGTLTWEIQSDTPQQQDWLQPEFFMVSSSESNATANTTNLTFLGTAFCKKYRISGLKIKKPNKPVVTVEAFNRVGHIIARNIIDVP